MTQPRTYRWQSTWARTSSPQATFSFAILSGPGTVQRTVGDVTWRTASPAFGGFDDCTWGLSVGTVAADPRDPNASTADWLIHRVCYVPAPADQTTVMPLAEQHIDIESQRVLDAGASLWFTVANFPGGPVFDWAGAFRVLILEPAAG